jgi:hypothetical protein
MKARSSTYQWPEALFPLRDWLARQGCDVDAFKSDRQAFFMARTIARARVSFPVRHEPMFPALLKLQEAIGLASVRGGRKLRQTSAEMRVKGTCGAAGPSRQIDIAGYLAERGGRL